MRAIWILLRRELFSYFVSPVAYTVLVAFLVVSGWYFHMLVARFQMMASQAMVQATMFQQMPPVMNVTLGVMRPWFNVTSQLLLFLTPLITMRLLAEERGTNRIDLLLSAPITDLQLILGKFLAGAALCFLFLAPTLVYPAILFLYGNPELGPILAGYLGLVLLILALNALGLAVSSLTNSQIVAAAASFGAIILLWILDLVPGGDGAGWRGVLSYIGMVGHFGGFANGVIETRHIVYYACFTLFMLFLTLRAVESQRWRG